MNELRQWLVEMRKCAVAICSGVSFTRNAHCFKGNLVFGVSLRRFQNFIYQSILIDYRDKSLLRQLIHLLLLR